MMSISKKSILNIFDEEKKGDQKGQLQFVTPNMEIFSPTDRL